jgi:hypothetical protein
MGTMTAGRKFLGTFNSEAWLANCFCQGMYDPKLATDNYAPCNGTRPALAQAALAHVAQTTTSAMDSLIMPTEMSSLRSNFNPLLVGFGILAPGSGLATHAELANQSMQVAAKLRGGSTEERK